jgi:hypothetical protein
LLVPSILIKALSILLWFNGAPIKLSLIIPLILSTAFNTPLPWYLNWSLSLSHP